MIVRSLSMLIPAVLSALSPGSGMAENCAPPAPLSIDNPLAPKANFESVAIPVKIIGQLIVLEAKADDQSGAFILDTGAPTLILNKTYFQKKSIPSNMVSVGLDGSASSSYSAIVDLFEMMGLQFPRVDARVSNLRIIEDHIGVKLLGLIGVSLLKDFIITIDINESVIHFTKNATKSKQCNSLRSMIPDLTIPMDLNGNSISLAAVIGGQPLRLALDTGAETNVLSAWLPKKVMGETLILKRMMLTGSTGGQVEALAGIIQKTEIGGIPFVKMRTIITNLNDLREAYGYRIDGMLGYDFFARGVTTLNFIDKTISMTFYNPVNKSDE